MVAALLSCTAGDPRPSDPVATQEAPLPDSKVAKTPSALPDIATKIRAATATAPPEAPPSKPTSSPVAASTGEADLIPLTEAPERDLYRLAAELTPGSPNEFPRVVPPDPPGFEKGRIDTFWLLDLPTLKMQRSDFELRLITPHAYWYIGEGETVSQKDLERSASAFEEETYPKITEALGTEWSPGIDNDPHINILSAGLRAIGGYYTSGDEYPTAVFPFSNEREIVYVNTGPPSVGTSGYDRTLAHEFQHAIHWNGDPSEETWINEGLSELAVTIAGYGQDLIGQFLRGTPTSLVNWPLSLGSSGAHYGAASLFMHYFYEHYATANGLKSFLTNPKDGIIGIDSYLADSGFDVTFRDIFGDWLVANLLDEDEGKHGHGQFDAVIRVPNTIDSYSEFSSGIPQYAAEYVEITSLSGPLSLSFQGNTETPLLPVDPGSEGCWWSNSGDSINSTLTRSLDLQGLEQATLNFELWYSLEELWDYAYLEVSTDQGQKWIILDAPHTSAENPVGNSYGMGYTGESGGWIKESVDLTAYAGQEILLRFQYITDDAVNGAGLCLRRISVPEAQPDPRIDDWEAAGFILIDNRVAQGYIVQVVEITQENRVTVMTLDDSNHGEIVVEAPQDLDRLVVIIAALAPKTLQPAPYTLSVALAK